MFPVPKKLLFYFIRGSGTLYFVTSEKYRLPGAY